MPESACARGGRSLLLVLLLGGTLQDPGTRGQRSAVGHGEQGPQAAGGDAWHGEQGPQAAGGDAWHGVRREHRLQVTFVTAQSSALLFLAAGETQYLMVELINGTLRVTLERGVGESVLNSPAWLALNDLEAHNVDLVVTRSRMALTLDNFSSHMDLPWPPEEMGIQRGLFLGGVGTLDLPYLPGVIPAFRGCILEATFDHMDLLSGPHPPAEFHGLWEACHIDPTPDSAGSLGFHGPRSYLMFPSWNASVRGSIHLILETSRPGRAPLLYQSGPRGSYFYIEISGGRLQGTLDTGESTVSIQNVAFVSDGRPHSVRIFTDSSGVQLGVDKSFSRVSTQGLGPGWDFHGNLYLGGVDEATLATMREGPLGNLFMDELEYRSFTGCLGDLRVNSQKKALRDAVVSRDVVVGCQEDEYNDYVEYEEAATAPVPTTTIASLSEPCMLDPNFPNLTSLLRPQPLDVTRGGSTILEWKHIRPRMDLGRAGIRQSQVVLRLVGSAQHGELELEIPGAEARRKFTLLDVANRKVRYVHDGSRSRADLLVLEVAVTGGAQLPECLRKGQRHRLLVNILPTAPVLALPSGRVLKMLAHGQKVLTVEDIQISDSDTPCDQLIVYVTGSSPEGHVELQHRPGEAVQEFSCRDLEEGHVAFIHESGTQAQLALQAGDGTSRSSPARLTILAVEPQIHVARNTGLVVLQGTSTLITPFNLSVVTNTDALGVETSYRLAAPPRLGEVQRLVEGGMWKSTEAFGQSEIERAGVRYLSTDAELRGEELSEELIIQVQLGPSVLSNHTFLVKVKRSTIQTPRMTTLRLGRRRELNLTESLLQLDTMGQGLHPAAVTYLLLQPPRKGNLQLQGQRLSEGSSFTQQNLQSGHLSYAATVRNPKETEDQFQVRLDAENSSIYTYKMQIGADPDAPELTNLLLYVLEGGEEAISTDHLFLKSVNSASFLYEVIDGPQHGTLIRKGPSGATDPLELGVTEFTNDDIMKGLLVYQHDGSETVEDDIPFVASRQWEGSTSDTSGEELEEEEEEVRGVFRVSIQPVNDNPPVQVVQKVFHVVRGGQRILTTNDIAFSDPDSGSMDAQLVLVRYGVPFGSTVFVDEPTLQVFRFTQEDLRMHRVLYIHAGPDHGSIQLQVSDGLHHLTTVLEVQASDPFLHIADVTVLNVPLGGQGTLGANDLGLETNIDIRGEDEVKYHIRSQPRMGEVLRGGEPTGSFSQHDLADGLVLYQHSGATNGEDRFRISAEVNQVVAEGDIEVHVVTETPDMHPRVIHNEKVYVFQGEIAEIKKEYLMVSAGGVFPHQVIYILTDPPSFGYLVSISKELSPDGSPSLDSVRTFTQEDVNQGKILYLHSSPEILPDRLTLQVTAGMAPQLEMEVLLEILPFHVPLEAAELRVDEGGVAALSPAILRVASDYFLALHLEFVVLDSPRRGRIVDAKRGELRGFSWNELDQGLVYYEHDGSETLTDTFTVLANASDINRQSRPITINITVLPLNDEGPRVVTNTGLQMLERATADLPPEALRSVDADSPPEEVVYSLLPPSNGQVVLRGSPRGVLRFSQGQLEQRQVQFVHQGPLDGGFFFNVSDGENQSEQLMFRIQATPLAVTMETAQDLIVCPGSLQQITSQHLKAVTNEMEAPPTALVFHIEEPSRIGQIVRGEEASREGAGLTNFTQSEVDVGVIYYQHIMPLTPFWAAQDSLSFHVTSPRAVSPRHRLRVTATFQGPCPPQRSQLWGNTGLHVLEGGSSPITRSTLDASNLLANLSASALPSHDVVFVVSSLPSRGHLSLHGAPLDPQLPHFMQSHLERGSLRYTHEGPGLLGDSFQFRAWLWPKSQTVRDTPPEAGSWVIAEALNVTIIEVPRLPPQIFPPRKPLQVAPGSYAALTPDHLMVEYPNTPPEDIIYTILELPEGTSLAVRGNQSVPVSRFSQEDLTKLRLILFANQTAASGAIRLNVTAGRHLSVMALLPVKVPAILTAPLEVPQASGRSVLTLGHFLPTMEGVPQDILYKVTQQPSYGRLVAGKEQVTEFRQGQVEAGEVSYIFTSFLSSRDGFGFLARSERGEEVAGMVAVAVTAWVKTGIRELWPRGCTVKLGTRVIDASELGTQTESVPTFRVLRQPRGGRLVRYSREGGRGEGAGTNAFTQSELERGLIGVELWEEGQSEPAVRDNAFQLELGASHVPPANVTVRFSTGPYNASYSYRATLLRVPGGSEPTPSLVSTTSFVVTTSPVPTPSLTPTTILVPSPSLTPTTILVPSPSLVPTSNPAPTPSPDPSHNATDSYTLASDLWESTEDFTVSTTQYNPTNVSWSMEVPTSPTPAVEGTFLGFMSAHMYSIVVPVCVVLFLTVACLLLLFLLRRKRMGKHHVQKAASSSAKPENGATDHQSFRPTEPDQGIPLCEVGAGHGGNGTGGQPSSQYWV